MIRSSFSAFWNVFRKLEKMMMVKAMKKRVKWRVIVMATACKAGVISIRILKQQVTAVQDNSDGNYNK